MATINDVNCLAGQWTKVTTGMKSGNITPLDNSPSDHYYATILTGGPAPTTIEDGMSFQGPIVYDAPVAVDIYVWPVLNAGSIRERKES